MFVWMLPVSNADCSALATAQVAGRATVQDAAVIAGSQQTYGEYFDLRLAVKLQILLQIQYFFFMHKEAALYGTAESNATSWRDVIGGEVAVGQEDRFGPSALSYPLSSGDHHHEQAKRKRDNPMKYARPQPAARAHTHTSAQIPAPTHKP